MKKRGLSETVLQRSLAAVCMVLLVSATAVAGTVSPRAGAAPDEGTATGSAPRSLPLLVDVGADTCIPCKMMAPILEKLRKEYTGVLEVRFVDVWKKPDEAEKYRIRGIPTQIFYDSSGKELGRHVGFIDKEGILEGFERLGVALKKPAGR